ncbi:MAG: tetratricopeptide repeat protein [Gammaproteobacteria bacterium]|nr:tetratricopeptide repeat protein [Gammaproteobacteria bacterium]
MSGLPTWTILGGGYQSYLKGDYKAAYDEWLPLAELGDVEAQYNLGVMYDQGASVDQDLGKAASWYRKAAEQGFLDAQANLGIMYFRGEGVPCDHTEAARWFQLAANKGDAEAANLLNRISSKSSKDIQTTAA